MNSVKFIHDYLSNVTRSRELFEKGYTVYAYDKVVKNKNMMFNTVLEGYSTEIKEKLYSDTDGLGK